MPLGENENKLDISPKMKHFISSPAVCERLSVRVCAWVRLCPWTFDYSCCAARPVEGRANH